MLQFKVTFKSPDKKITAKELKEILDQYAMHKLKTEGIEYRLGPIEVEEITGK